MPSHLEQSAAFPERSGPYLYDLEFHLEVEGEIALMSTTRYYRYEELHLRTVARLENGHYQFEALGLSRDNEEINSAIGEGPRRHQRYVLFNEPPTDEEIARLRERMLPTAGETGRLEDDPQGADVDTDTEADPAHEETAERKRAYLNCFLWRCPYKGFSFSQACYGSIPVVKNDVELEVLLKEGGRKAKPRFFETLQYALRAIPPFIDPTSGTLALSDNSWQVPCRPVMEGLVDLCREVYGRKMTILEPEALGADRMQYASHRVAGTPIVKIAGRFDNGTPTSIRVSGFKGEVWIHSFRREIFFDTATGRILKDDLRLEFGIQRTARLLALKGQKNEVHIVLVDQCFRGCPDTDTGIALAARTCSSTTP